MPLAFALGCTSRRVCVLAPHPRHCRRCRLLPLQPRACQLPQPAPVLPLAGTDSTSRRLPRLISTACGSARPRRGPEGPRQRLAQLLGERRAAVCPARCTGVAVESVAPRMLALIHLIASHVDPSAKLQGTNVEHRWVGSWSDRHCLPGVRARREQRAQALCGRAEGEAASLLGKI